MAIAAPIQRDLWGRGGFKLIAQCSYRILQLLELLLARRFRAEAMLLELQVLPPPQELQVLLALLLLVVLLLPLQMLLALPQVVLQALLPLKPAVRALLLNAPPPPLPRVSRLPGQLSRCVPLQWEMVPSWRLLLPHTCEPAMRL